MQSIPRITIIQDRIIAARHVADQVKELSAITRRHRFDSLTYLLDMAALEADQLAGINASERK
ncbi:hypothetical protein [Variibacter gotjawalensis]|uniref:hypothetical protein n=1 Tax=Variibacter gotjawalensis TaxID=1333996 RepID=UPI000BBA628A|nr:hypothetical protein [Variibacter gotjawalensis]NIK46589.1 hypothetical protein [Variibacter gotjawalensis]